MSRIRTTRAEVEKASHRLAEVMYQKTSGSPPEAGKARRPRPPPARRPEEQGEWRRRR